MLLREEIFFVPMKLFSKYLVPLLILKKVARNTPFQSSVDFMISLQATNMNNMLLKGILKGTLLVFIVQDSSFQSTTQRQY